MNLNFVFFSAIALASAYMSLTGDELGAIWTLLLGILMFLSLIAGYVSGEEEQEDE